MCLTISIQLRGMGTEEAELVTDQIELNKLELHIQKSTSLFVHRTAVFSLSEVGEGCACSMLTDNADWNAPTWEFQATMLADLADSIKELCERAPNGLILEALWAGEKPKQILEISCNHLLDIVRSNSISTAARYIVTAA